MIFTLIGRLKLASSHITFKTNQSALTNRLLPATRNQTSRKYSRLTGISGMIDGKGDIIEAVDHRGTQELVDNEPSEGWLSRIDRSIAKSRKIRGGNFVQIATVDQENKPHCRTVVFRGFVDINIANLNNLYGATAAEDGGGTLVKTMKMITDRRSEKVSQINASPACEMVWWFSQSNEQYRFNGDLLLIGEDHPSEDLKSARKQQWGNLSDTAREQFFWHTPGNAYEGVAEVPKGGRDSVDGKVLPPPCTFLLMLLVPEQVKYLRLTDNYAEINRLTVTPLSVGDKILPGESSVDSLIHSKWTVERINP